MTFFYYIYVTYLENLEISYLVLFITTTTTTTTKTKTIMINALWNDRL